MFDSPKHLLVLLLAMCMTGCDQQLRPVISHKASSNVEDVLFIDHEEKVVFVDDEQFATYAIDGTFLMQSDPISDTLLNSLHFGSYSVDRQQLFLGRTDDGILCYDFTAKKFVSEPSL